MEERHSAALGSTDGLFRFHTHIPPGQFSGDSGTKSQRVWKYLYWTYAPRLFAQSLRKFSRFVCRNRGDSQNLKPIGLLTILAAAQL